MLTRFAIFAFVIIALALAGLVDLGDLPWGSHDFRASGAVVLLYLFWSLSEKRSGQEGLDPSRLVLYIVLLVSTVDSFLLRITVWNGLYVLRYAGAALLALGSVLRLAALSKGRRRMLRAGRILQLIGLPIGLGSIAGTAVGAITGAMAASKETLPARDIIS
jgi:hypothetical protein